MNEKYLRRAIGLAEKNASLGRGGPFGAVIVKEGRVVSVGVNQVTGTHDPTAHAEVVAIRRACRRLGHFELKGCVLYSSCEPCPMCLSAIYWARVEGLVYAATRFDASAVGFDDGFLYEQIPLEESQRSLRTVRALAAEGLAPFEAWRRMESRVPY